MIKFKDLCDVISATEFVKIQINSDVVFNDYFHGLGTALKNKVDEYDVIFIGTQETSQNIKLLVVVDNFKTMCKKNDKNIF